MLLSLLPYLDILLLSLDLELLALLYVTLMPFSATVCIPANLNKVKCFPIPPNSLRLRSQHKLNDCNSGFILVSTSKKFGVNEM